jgi:hypothetical protein
MLVFIRIIIKNNTYLTAGPRAAYSAIGPIPAAVETNKSSFFIVKNRIAQYRFTITQLCLVLVSTGTAHANQHTGTAEADTVQYGTFILVP